MNQVDASLGRIAHVRSVGAARAPGSGRQLSRTAGGWKSTKRAFLRGLHGPFVLEMHPVFPAARRDGPFAGADRRRRTRALSAEQRRADPGPLQEPCAGSALSPGGARPAALPREAAGSGRGHGRAPPGPGASLRARGRAGQRQVPLRHVPAGGRARPVEAGSGRRALRERPLPPPSPGATRTASPPTGAVPGAFSPREELATCSNSTLSGGEGAELLLWVYGETYVPQFSGL